MRSACPSYRIAHIITQQTKCISDGVISCPPEGSDWISKASSGVHTLPLVVATTSVDIGPNYLVKPDGYNSLLALLLFMFSLLCLSSSVSLIVSFLFFPCSNLGNKLLHEFHMDLYIAVLN